MNLVQRKLINWFYHLPGFPDAAFQKPQRNPATPAFLKKEPSHIW